MLLRDFFLDRATADCLGFTAKYASAGNHASMGVRVLMGLDVPENKSNSWYSTGVKMLSEISAAGFVRHSETATVPSMLAALGVSKADRALSPRRGARNVSGPTRW